MSSMWMEFYHERAPSSESWWHGKGSRNGARRTGINSKCSCFQVLNEVLENLSKINLHLTDTSLIQSPGPWKTETNSPCAGLTRTAFPFVQVDWVQRVSDSPPHRALFQWIHSELCDSDKGYKYPHFGKRLQILCAWCNWHKTQTAPWVPDFSSPTLQHFKWLQAELPETVVNSWHRTFPWSQLACQKRLSFSPRKVMYFAGTGQMPQERQMRDLFWPTNETAFPFSARALRFSYNKHKMFVSKETKFIFLKWF